jgi:hypothetical protein
MRAWKIHAFKACAVIRAEGAFPISPKNTDGMFATPSTSLESWTESSQASRFESRLDFTWRISLLLG